MNAVVGSTALSFVEHSLHGPSISPLQNHLLASLPEAVQADMFPHLESCMLTQGTVLARPGLAVASLYFPTDALVSRHCMTAENEAGTAMSIVGNDGVIGIDLFMEDCTTPTISVVQVTGHAYRVDARRLKKDMGRHENLLAVLSQHSHSLLAQMAHTAVCNRHHTLEQQLCRWLLLSSERLPGNEFRMSLEQMALALGVERPTVAEAARRLQKAGVVKCFKGRVTLLDRDKLEASSCGCHEVIARESHRQWPAGVPQLDGSLRSGAAHYH